MSEHAPRLEKVKLIDYDFKKFGAAAERKRLLGRWDSEIGSLR
jgi:iron(III) transport system substrate-binding protein